MSDRLNVLAVATYPVLAAATRFRIAQYVPLLAEHGIDVDLRPFLSDRAFKGLYRREQVLQTSAAIARGVGRRLKDAVRLGSYDLLFVQREAALIGPALFEWLAHRSMPMVLDLDDSTYVERPSDVYGALAHFLKFHGKTKRMIGWADHVVCGNPTIARYVSERQTAASILPTIVDVGVFTPRPHAKANEPLVIGWIGTHSTYVYLQQLMPVFRRLAETTPFRLKVIGAGRNETVDGVDVEFIPWTLEREVADLQSFDLAVYPIIADEWAEGKSGFKAIQYLSCGVPYVATPVGVVREIGLRDVTHFEARTSEEWLEALRRLANDASLRARLGAAGRAYAVEHYSTQRSASALASIFRSLAAKKNGRP
jgi:glycosyltransferase involved in cell wall biosynthesis